MSGWERPGWLVRVRHPATGEPIGAGVLCTDRHILTCAHVLAPAGATEPPPAVVVDFPFAEPHEPMAARVRPDGWFPTAADGTGDLAVLELVDELPRSALPAPMRVSDGVTGHRFRATGFPSGHDGAVTSRGVVVGPAETEWLQLQAESALGFSLEAGFSGAPLWDEDTGAVVGIVVSRERARGALGDPRTGYAIPLEVVEQYWAGLRPWLGWRLDHDPDLRVHWAPRARGVARESLAGWHFTGRTAAISRLVRWLGAPGDQPLHVVTGGPGSGKSAVLARLVTLADPLTRRRIVAEAPDQLAATVPPVGAVSLAIRCTGLDLSRTCRALSRFRHPTDDPDTAIADLVAGGTGTVVVDALDEAVDDGEARSIAVRLLRPLAEAGARSGVTVLVATRRGHNDSLLRALGPAAHTDLDDPDFFDPADLTGYAERLLLDGSYRDTPDTAREVAEAIARRGRPSFLVTGLTARAWAGRAPVDPRREDQEFPADVDEAMREYLHRLPGADRALTLLRILAHGRRPGLTLDLWEAVATAFLSTVSRAEIDGLLRAAAAYLVEQRTADGEPTVSLFHQALVDHLCAMDTSGLVERTIADVLVRDTTARGGWLHAREYARQHAVDHEAAARGQLLEDLVTDPAFLVVAERGAVLRALRTEKGKRIIAVGAVYQAAAHALARSAPVNAAHLELTARRAGEHDLADRVRALGLDQPFTTRFASPTPVDHRTLAGQTTGIAALAWGVRDGRPVLVSGGQDGTVTFWDPADGTLLDSVDGDGAVSSLGWVEVDGTRRLAAARTDTVTLWDLTRRLDKPRVVRLADIDTDGPPGPGWQGAIDAVPDELAGSAWHQEAIATGFGRLAGRPVLMRAHEDGSVHTWRVEDGVLTHVLRAHLWGGAADWGEPGGRPTLITIGNDEVVTSVGEDDPTRRRRMFIREDGFVSHGLTGTVRFWDPERRAVDRDRDLVVDALANACALTVSDGHALLAVSCDDERVRVLDLADGAEVADFPGQPPLAWGTVAGGTVLACTGDDHVVQVWDATNPAEPHAVVTNDAVSALAWGEFDGRPFLAAGGQSGRIQLWPAPDRVAPRPARSQSRVRALAWQDGLLAVGAGDGQVTVLDPTTPDRATTIAAHRGAVGHLAWGRPDGRPALATATYDGEVAVWDPVTARRVFAPPRLDEYLRLLSWVDLDGDEMLAMASGAVNLHLWGVDGRHLAPRLPRVGEPVRFLFTVLGDGVPAVVCGVGSEVRVYDAVDWEVISWSRRGTSPADEPRQTCLATTFVDGAPITARGDADGKLIFWFPHPAFQFFFDPVDAHDGPVLAVAWGRSEATAAVLASGGADGLVLVWDVTDPERPDLLGAIDVGGPVTALTWTVQGDEDVVVAGTATGNTYLYGGFEWTAGGVQVPASQVTALAATTNHTEHVTAIGTAEGYVMLLFQSQDGEQEVYDLPMPGLAGAVSALSWSFWSDGWLVLAIGLADGGVLTWDAKRSAGEDGHWHVDDPAAIRTVAPPTGTSVSALCWAPAGPPTLLVGAADGMLRTWDVAEAAETHAFSTDQYADTVLATGTLDGRTVLATTGSMLRVWDLATETSLLVSDEQGHSNNQLLFGRLDERTVMIQHTHDGVRIWDPLLTSPPHVVAAPRSPRTTPLPPAVSRLSRSAIGIATDLTPPVLAFGTLHGHPTIALGTATGLITLTDLRDGTQRTIDWYSPVETLALGPDNQLAIGDPQGYTVLLIAR